jgi:hypothetical protein
VRKLGVGEGGLGEMIELVRWIDRMMILLRMPVSQRRRRKVYGGGEQPIREEVFWSGEDLSWAEDTAGPNRSPDGSLTVALLDSMPSRL